jgi:phosphatidylserine/phosphatidylglycerophosphate/cardiolipin synthase-like enzyme
MFNKIIIYLTILVLVLLCTLYLSNHYYHKEFKIIYSLDKKQNDIEIIDLINNSDKYIYFAVFTFTKDNIANALIKAKQKGVLIWGITDLQQSETAYENPVIEKLKQAGIFIETQKHTDGIMHIKAIVTDKAYAIGSYNWTESATVANDEILEIGYDKEFHDQYLNILKKVLTVNQ